MAISKEYRSYWRTVHSVRFIDLSTKLSQIEDKRTVDRWYIISQLASTKISHKQTPYPKHQTLSSSCMHMGCCNSKWEIFSARISRKKRKLRLLPVYLAPIQSHLHTTNVGDVLVCIGVGEKSRVKNPLRRKRRLMKSKTGLIKVF